MWLFLTAKIKFIQVKDLTLQKNRSGMAKIQLYISKSQRGFKSLVNLNPWDDVQRHIHDLDRAVELVSYDAARKNIFYVVSYLDSGCFFTIIRTIPERPVDHLEATLFIPAGLIVTADELSSVVERTISIISGASVSADDLAELRTLYATDYPVAGEEFWYIPSEGREYAVCLVGGSDSMALEAFYADRYQPAFASYAGVVLLPEGEGLEAKDNARILKTYSSERTVPLSAPEPGREGFVPHILRHTFDRTYLFAIGKTLEIVWRRAGFEPVTQEITVGESATVITPPDTSVARKAISPASFYITAQNKQPIESDCIVKVNGVEITEPTTFTYSELERAQVEISAHGYFPYIGRLDLASTTQALVQLMELRKVYRFELPVSTADHASPVRFEIRSKKEITASPVEGYVTGSGTIAEGTSKINNLIYVGSRARRSLLVTVLLSFVSLIAGVLIGWLAFSVDVSEEQRAAAPESVESRQTVDDLPEEEAIPATEVPDVLNGPEAPADISDRDVVAVEAVSDEKTSVVADLASAVAYLDANSVWKKEDMESNAVLVGLFDDMNNYRMERLKNHWAEVLKDSKNFAAVAKAARMGAGKRDPRTGKHTPAYNPDAADTSIHWLGYTSWIDP